MRGNEGRNSMFVRRLEESPREHRGGQGSHLMLAKGEFGSSNLAITWVEGGPGSQQDLHEHPGAEQVHVVVRGRGEMIVGEERHDVGPGTMILIPPGTDHAIRNVGEDTLVWVSATSPPFDPSAVGRWVPPTDG